MSLTLILLIAALLLQVVDGVTTYIGIAGDTAYERVPIGAWLLGKIGLVPMIVLMKALASTFIVVAYLLRSEIALGVIVTVYVGIAINNLRVLARSR